jgi:hypothetical protein
MLYMNIRIISLLWDPYKNINSYFGNNVEFLIMKPGGT